MDLTLFLARVLGLYFLAMGFALLLNSKHVKSAIDAFGKYPGLFFVNGLFILLIGLLMVVGHNVWNGGVSTLVTVIGWLALFKGLMWVLLPDRVIKSFTSWKESSNLFFIGGLVCLILGIYLGAAGLY